MKNYVVRRLLVGALALTTFFSTFESAVVFTVDGETAIAAEYQSDDSDCSLKDNSFAEKSDSASEGSAPEASEDASAESSQDNNTQVSAESSSESSAEASSESSSESSSEGPEESPSEASTESSVEVSPKAPEEPGNASSESTSIETAAEESSAAASSAEDAADEASSESSEDASSSSSSEETPSENKPSEEYHAANDLNNPEFGIVDNFELPDEIGDINEEITLSFDFHVFDAEAIPDGIFTYTLPDELDFSGILGKEIEVRDGDVLIGKAVFTDPHVITFIIDKKYLENKPNGINGSVKLECKIADAGNHGDEPIRIEFPGEQVKVITVKKPVITATKAPVVISSGEASFEVVFDVSADTDDFTITDVLGENLEFVPGSWTFKTSNYGKVPATFSLADSHTLNVNVGKIKKGKYVLFYRVKATKLQDAVATDAIEKGYGNTATWQWKGCTGEHEVISYATCSIKHDWLRKNRIGAISADGVAGWYVYINNGSRQEMAGKKLVDILDSRMEFSSMSVEVEYSLDGKIWRHYDYATDISKDGDNWKLQYTFPDDAPAYGYRLKYYTKITNLPTDTIVYSNSVYLYDGDTLLDEATEKNGYYHVGKFDSRIEKNVLERDNATGIVTWISEFTVNGERANYPITIKDNIAPAVAEFAGKKIGVKMLEGIELVKVNEDNTTTPITKFKVTYGESSFTLTVDKLVPGSYRLYYKTQHYYGSEGDLSFPQGSTIDIINHTELIIDGRKVQDDASYPITTEGLPLMKEALKGYSENGRYIIPWKVYINKNELGQTNGDIESGAKATVTEILPDKLRYLAGSTVITKADGTTFGVEPVAEKSAELGDVLKWNFTWEKAGDNYYVLEFKSYVKDEYLSEIKKMAQDDGTATVSFDNNVIATVGGSIGGTNASAVEEFKFLKKTAGFDENTQQIEYEIVVNREAVDLKADSDTLVLGDTLKNGFFVEDSLKV